MCSPITYTKYILGFSTFMNTHIMVNFMFLTEEFFNILSVLQMVIIVCGTRFVNTLQ